MLVFVYGTLKQGNSLNQYIQQGRFVRKDILDGWEMYCSGFPMIIRGKGQVKGEVWDIPDYLLDTLDRVEGVPHMYRRQITQTISGKLVWVYVWNMSLEGLVYLPSGEFEEKGEYYANW